MITSHVRLLTPAATNVYWRYVLVGETTTARATRAPSIGLLLMVAVIAPPGCTLVALTATPGPVMVTDWAAEVPPTGAGVNTVMLSAPELTRSLARMVAVSWVADTNNVLRTPVLSRRAPDSV